MNRNRDFRDIGGLFPSVCYSTPNKQVMFDCDSMSDVKFLISNKIKEFDLDKFTEKEKTNMCILYFGRNLDSENGYEVISNRYPNYQLQEIAFTKYPSTLISESDHDLLLQKFIFKDDMIPFMFAMCRDDANIDILFKSIFCIIKEMIEREATTFYEKEKIFTFVRSMINMIGRLIFQLLTNFLFTTRDVSEYNDNDKRDVTQYIEKYFYYCSKSYVYLLDAIQNSNSFSNHYYQFYLFKNCFDRIINNLNIVDYYEYQGHKHLLSFGSISKEGYPEGPAGIYHYDDNTYFKVYFSYESIIKSNVFSKLYSFWINILPLNKFYVTADNIDSNFEFEPTVHALNNLYDRPLLDFELVDGFFGEGKTTYFNQNSHKDFVPIEQDEVIRELYFLLNEILTLEDDAKNLAYIDHREIDIRPIIHDIPQLLKFAKQVFMYEFMPRIYSLCTLRFLSYSHNYFAANIKNHKNMISKVVIDRSWISNTVFQDYTVPCDVQVFRDNRNVILSNKLYFKYKKIYSFLMFHVQMQYMYYNNMRFHEEENCRLKQINFKITIINKLQSYEFYKALMPFHSHRTMEAELYSDELKLRQSYYSFKARYEAYFNHFFPINICS